jgi:PAS domain S-box-containing protein
VVHRAPKRVHLWRRRSIRDAIAVAGICAVASVAAAAFNLSERTTEFLKRYESYQLDEAITVALVFGLLMLVYALRRVQDLKREILKRRDAETDRARHASLLITAVNNSPQGLLMFGSDGRLIVCNERYIRMYGLSPDVVKPGRTLLELLVHRRQYGTFDFDPKEYEAKIRAAARSGQKASVTDALPDGRVIEMVTHPMPEGGWVATHEDVTDRRQAEARVAKEADENRSLFDTSQDLILVTDRLGTFVRVSPISSSILGYSPEEMVGRNGAEFVHSADLESTRNEMRQARRGRNMRNFATRYVHKQGHIVTMAWSGVWSEPAQKYFFTGRDVTESKRAEEKLRYLAQFDHLTG